VATELVLRHGNGRVRVIFQYAPAWAKQDDVEPSESSTLPSALKLYRCLVSRERLVTNDHSGPPTAQSERENPPTAAAPGNPTFFRPVPPFDWFQQWGGGSSWTYGPQAGHQGWSIQQLDETDDWHGRAPTEVWNLRLPGGIAVQAARIVTAQSVAPCRLAWLPTTDTLLRLQASVWALQPIFVPNDDNDDDEPILAGFELPTLASYRCDILANLGDLENAPSLVDEQGKQPKETQSLDDAKSTEPSSVATKAVQPRPPPMPPQQAGNNDSDVQAIHDALQL
jgi:hypothetical protein